VTFSVGPCVPALDTARLTLRGHTPADFADCAAMWADSRVTQHIGGRPASDEEVWARVLRYAGLWKLLGFGYWVVRERASGQFVGEVGLADCRRDLTPPLNAPEAGWVLAAGAHGRGFATEAVGAALAWADLQAEHPALAAGRTACLIAPDNLASVRVAAKCGFGPVATATYKGEATLILERRAVRTAPGGSARS
jgi:RimJ/RimL family protein N-acetyltransferase